MITYDHKSFIIKGQRVFLNSAAIHYFRMPREEWREVLVKAKLAGMNCVDTYFAWNVHEPMEGQWDFTGDKDCGAFLDLCSELGLWVIARPGPYICAEWDFGGFPWWLNLKAGIKLREYNDVYLHYVDLYLDQLIPLIEKRQITQGGSVILVQVENEYAHVGSDEEGSQYLNYLRDGTISRGVNVPLISCEGGVEGTIEGGNFWSGADSSFTYLQQKQSNVPKIVTEFWTGWFEYWGAAAELQKTPNLLEKRIMEAIRAGFDGLNYYMFFGGTNFADYNGRTVGSSDIFMVTSYDYNAPLNEYGRITDKYLVTKRINYFINTLSEFLLESEEKAAKVTATVGGLVRERSWLGQTIYFVENNKVEREEIFFTTDLGKTYHVTAMPGQIVPVLADYEIMPNVCISYNSFIACNEFIGGEHILVLFAGNGQRTSLEISSKDSIQYEDTQLILHEINHESKRIRFDLYHFAEPQIIRLTCGMIPLSIVVLNTDTMDLSWRVETPDGVRFVIGSEDLHIKENGSIEVGLRKQERNILVWGLPRFNSQSASNEMPMLLNPPSLVNWRFAQETMGEKSGRDVEGPIDFSAFGQPFGYLLYSTTIQSETDRLTTLIIPRIQDAARIYINGTEQGCIRNVVAAQIEVELIKGSNLLQILVQNMGRYNFSIYLGEAKGLSQPIYLDGKAIDFRRNWLCQNKLVHLDEVILIEEKSLLTKSFAIDHYNQAILVGVTSSFMRINGEHVDFQGYNNWYNFNAIDISAYLVRGENTIEMEYYKSVLNRLELLVYHSSNMLDKWWMAPINEKAADHQWEITQNEFERKPTWFKCEFDMPVVNGKSHHKLKLRMTGMSKGSIWLNGINLGKYWQIGPQEDYKIPLSWLKEWNELVIFDEEGRSPSKIRLLNDEQSSTVWSLLI